jgi:hypothetical protein
MITPYVVRPLFDAWSPTVADTSQALAAENLRLRRELAAKKEQGRIRVE